MSDMQQNKNGHWEQAEEVPFSSFEVVRYRFWPHWVEIEMHHDGYVVDSDLLREELVFSTADELLDWLDQQKLTKLLSDVAKQLGR